MNSWHTVKVKYTKEFTDGTLKRVTEPYLVSAISFTDAEARIYQEVGEFVRGEFIVTSIAKTDFNDIIQYDDTDTWYKCKVSYVSEDADSGKEKKVNTNYLVSANNVKEAYDRLEESMKGLMVSYEIPMIAVTQYVEIYPFEPGDDQAVSTEESVDSDNEEPTSSVNVAYAVGSEEE